MGKIADLLENEDVLLDLDVRDKDALFEVASRGLARGCAVAAEDILAALMRRERLGATALGQEVAVPHASVEGLDGIHVLYARLKQPCYFDGGNGMPVVHALFLIVPAPANQTHLDILAEAARLFSQPEFQKALRRGQSPDEVRQAFADWSARSAVHAAA
ncbi:PTS sugar transporter subunit IIA [Bordetella genomosp. 13]|uniref:PTS sugar transporter subunit IIA n=1 Tax=Bordetella genomosp. 13 TaxID=463040 RepID=UPI0011A126DE|nr:PTS sugar transporter subunit IIA [Bordetella genomosp. 13]